MFLFFSPWLSNFLNDNMHMVLHSIVVCQISSLNIDVFFYDKLQECPFYFLVCMGGAFTCVLGFILAFFFCKVILYARRTHLLGWF